LLCTRPYDWLLDRVVPVAEAFARVTRDGTRADVYSYWVSAHGQGGPMLSVPQMRQLAMLGLECIYDVYFEGDDKNHAE
jgi:hypothetical protein